jgi:Zn finger protein HypA/HybF involved in hydrogenase expression
MDEKRVWCNRCEITGKVPVHFTDVRCPECGRTMTEDING